MTSAPRTRSKVYGDDLRPGQVYQLGTYTVSEEELVEYASRWDPQDFHTDARAAAAGAYGGLIASGVHTIAIYQRLSVSGIFTDWSVIAGKELRQVRFLRPVRPDDTLTGTVRILDVEFDDRNRALVTTEGMLDNQNDSPVLSLVVAAYIRAHPDR